MRTAVIIMAGILLLTICIGAARVIGNNAANATGTAVKIFIAIWFLAAAINMWIGIAHAGYSFLEELPIFLIIFGLPAAVGLFVQWKLR